MIFSNPGLLSTGVWDAFPEKNRKSLSSLLTKLQREGFIQGEASGQHHAHGGTYIKRWYPVEPVAPTQLLRMSWRADDLSISLGVI